VPTEEKTDSREMPFLPTALPSLTATSTFTPTPTSTFTPTNTPTPTSTPTPTPGGNNPSSVVFNQEIPQVELNIGDYCPTSQLDPIWRRLSARLPCATDAYNNYRDLLIDANNVMTWGRFVSLVIYAEGHTIMVGRRDQSGQSVYDNPQTSISGSRCYRYSSTDSSFKNGEGECAPGIQRHFPWAVVEWIFNECAVSVGFARTYHVMPDGTQYTGTCTEAGFKAFLGSMHSLYDAPAGVVNFDIELYLPRAEEELGFFRYEATRTPDDIYRAYGECPCNWGNVGSAEMARIGLNGSDNSYSYYFNPTEDPSVQFLTIR